MKNKRKLNILPAITFIIFLSACTGIFEDGNELAADCSKHINNITVDELNAKHENAAEFLLLDCRQSEEYAAGNIPGSFNIARGELEFKILDDDFWEEEFMYTPYKTDTIIIYSKSGGRASLAAESLIQLGFENVYNLKGGWIAFNGDNELIPIASSGGCGE